MYLLFPRFFFLRSLISSASSDGLFLGPMLSNESCAQLRFLFMTLKGELKQRAFLNDPPNEAWTVVQSWDCQKCMKVSMSASRIPRGGAQPVRRLPRSCRWPLETLHAQQQNGRPSTDRLHSALKFKFFCTLRVTLLQR